MTADNPVPNSAKRQRQVAWQKRMSIEKEIQRDAGRILGGRSALKRFLGTQPVLEFGLRAIGLRARGYRNAQDIQKTELELQFDHLPAAFDSLRILHLTDFHFHGQPEFVEVVCNRVKRMPADLCILTGDYNFNKWETSETREGIEAVLRTVKAPLGVFAILGNNDYSRDVKMLREAGAHVLINDAYTIQREGSAVCIAGIDDPNTYACDSISAALSNRPDGAFTVLLAHSPERIDEALKHGVDLYLCGHTHGGQIRLPGLPPIVKNCKCPPDTFSGRWQRNSLLGFTSRGLGATAVHARFNCSPEAVRITLKRGATP